MSLRRHSVSARCAIAGIAGDQQAALFGQMCVAPGMSKNTYGTGCFLLQNIGTTAAVSTNKLLTTVAWRIKGRTEYALEGSVFIGGAVVQWLRDGLELIDSAPEIEDLAASVPDNGGVYLVPAFAGLGAPHWDPYARGTIVGVTRGTTGGHIARAALESIAFQVADILEAMHADSGVALRELRVDGGAAANNMLMQFQADLLRRAGRCARRSPRRRRWARPISRDWRSGSGQRRGTGRPVAHRTSLRAEDVARRGQHAPRALARSARTLARVGEARRERMNRDTHVSRFAPTPRAGTSSSSAAAPPASASRSTRRRAATSVLLVEQHDFGKGTSSRSTKLVHGGVRYLEQGNISLVMEALKERGLLRQNAPHLVRDLAFVVPNYDWWEAPFYGIGLKVYDLLAGKYGFGPSEVLSRDETLERLPTIKTEGLRGGVVYYDGQFDDARLLINLVRNGGRAGRDAAQLRAGRPACTTGRRRLRRRPSRPRTWRRRHVHEVTGARASSTRPVRLRCACASMADAERANADRAEPGHSSRLRSIVPARRTARSWCRTRATAA